LSTRVATNLFGLRPNPKYVHRAPQPAPSRHSNFLHGLKAFHGTSLAQQLVCLSDMCFHDPSVNGEVGPLRDFPRNLTSKFVFDPVCNTEEVDC
jgi:hypothetical protein